MANNFLKKISNNENTISKYDSFKKIYSSFIHDGYEKKQVSFSRLGDIEKYLPYFQGKALNLYVFYLSKAKNETGESFWSIQSIADQLKAAPKSVSNWNKNLIDLGLIYRSNTTSDSSTKTYLLPTQSFIIPIDSNEKQSEYRIYLKNTDYQHNDSYSIEIEKDRYINYEIYLKKVALDSLSDSKSSDLNKYIILMHESTESISKTENTILISNEDVKEEKANHNLQMLKDKNILTKEKISLLIQLTKKE